jgi:hypothetical protein
MNPQADPVGSVDASSALSNSMPFLPFDGFWNLLPLPGYQNLPIPLKKFVSSWDFASAIVVSSGDQNHFMIVHHMECVNPF